MLKVLLVLVVVEVCLAQYSGICPGGVCQPILSSLPCCTHHNYEIPCLQSCGNRYVYDAYSGTYVLSYHDLELHNLVYGPRGTGGRRGPVVAMPYRPSRGGTGGRVAVAEYKPRSVASQSLTSPSFVEQEEEEARAK